MRRLRGLLAAFLVVAVGGCGAPDRRDEAQRLGEALKAMPGVTDAHVSYENAIGRGASLGVYVFAPDASRQQFVDLVNRYNEVRGNRFDRYDQNVTIHPAPAQNAEIRCGSELDADVIATQAMALRELSSRVSAGDTDWWCGPQNRTLTIRENRAPVTQVLQVLHASGADVAPVRLDLTSASSSTEMDPFSVVHITFPFTVEDWSRFQALASRLDTLPWSAVVGPGSTIAGLGVSVESPSAAEPELVSVIAAVGADERHPLNLSWTFLGAPPGKPDEKSFKGQVQVGGCSATFSKMEIELHPEKYLTPEAVALQKRLRETYEVCPK